MLRKIVAILICIVFIGISTISNLELGYASDLSESEVPTTSFANYHIQYNGEEQRITINDHTTLTLVEWGNESQTTVKGILSILSDATTSHQEITLHVSEESQELVIGKDERFIYQITKSDSFNVEIKEDSSSNEPLESLEENTPKSDLETEQNRDTEEESQIVEKNQEDTALEVDETQNPTELIEKGSNAATKEKVDISIQSSSIPSISYSTHVQNEGWQESVKDGATSGTIGEAKRLEAIKISGIPGISYRTHVQDFGWQNFVKDGALSGTEGKAKRLEAIQIKLTGDPANQYDIYYRVHAEHYGWLGWAKNGQSAGTAGLAKRLEAIEIKLVKKGGQPPGSTTKPFATDPSVSYSTHVQDYGWMSFVEDGAVSGTQGKAKRLEAIKIQLKNKPFPGNIVYSTHVQDYGWLSNVSNGQLSGTTGKNKRLEAIKIDLTGEMADHYDIYYRVHAEHNGWLGWTKNGESAGTAGFGRRLEAIEIKLVEKGGPAPGSTANSFIIGKTISYSTHVEDYGWMSFVENGALSGTEGKAKKVEAIKIQFKNAPYPGSVVYSTHVQDYGWLPNVSNGQISGTTGKNKRLEAIKIDLTGEMAEHYDIYYRVHIEHYGWLGWAKNGMKSGTENAGRRLEAIEIKLVEKGKGEPVNESDAFKNLKFTDYNYYNLTFDRALNLQVNARDLPQTDIDPIAYISSENTEVYGSITGFGVNLRKLPNLSSPVGAYVNHGEKLIVLDDNVSGDAFQGSTNWLKINYNGQVLYVHSQLARVDYAVVTQNGVRIREQPNTDSHIFATVNTGTQLTVLDVGDSWHQVRYNTPSWRNASQSEVAYYLNPANFVNDEKQMLQFLDLSQQVSVSADVLNQFLKGKGILEGKGQVYVDASRSYGINVVYLMAHSLLETGNGTSKLANGLSYNGKTVYNVYGIGARDDNPNGLGAQKAYEYGWFDIDTAIKGGAKWIRDNYLNVGQNTLYEMRWNPQAMVSLGKADHQYATDIGWAYKQINRLYEIMNAVYQTQRYTIYLEIPVYK